MARIVVVGASGGVGSLLSAQAAAAGHEVIAAMRSPVALPGARVERCDVLDASSVGRVVGNADAVVSCVGLRRANPRNPWSRLITARDVCSRGTAHLVAALPAGARLVVVSACGVGDSAHQMPLFFRALLAVSNIGVAYQDLDAMEQALQRSSLDWTSVRPAALWDGPCTGRARVVPRDQHVGAAWISRADVADYLLQAALHPGAASDRTPSIVA